MFSDKRLMTNITLLKAQQEIQGPGDTVYLFPNIYSWEWNDKATEFSHEQRRHLGKPVGVIAQELELIGFASYVDHVDTEVDGLDGFVRDVNTEMLMKYGNYVGFGGRNERDS